jgi:hypothetical protein
VTAKLVARKKTYKLNLAGMTPARFRETVKAGDPGLPEPVAVELDLVITNNTKSDVRVRTAGAVPRLALTLTGPGAVEGKTTTRGPKTRVTYTVLRPGQSVTVPVNSLSSRPSASGYTRQYWSEPGEYSLSATFYTSIDMNWAGPGAVRARAPYTTLKARAIKLTVEK